MFTKAVRFGEGNTHRTYDAAGNLASERDALGRTTYYFRDARNRLIRTRDANGYDTTTTIGRKIGLKTKATNGSDADG